MEYYKDDFHWNPKAKVPLRIVIVGAGIAGLVAAIGILADAAFIYQDLRLQP